jgi:hypothetical protein
MYEGTATTAVNREETQVRVEVWNGEPTPYSPRGDWFIGIEFAVLPPDREDPTLARGGDSYITKRDAVEALRYALEDGFVWDESYGWVIDAATKKGKSMDSRTARLARYRKKSGPWNLVEEVAALTPAKMKALGVSETFLAAAPSGEEYTIAFIGAIRELLDSGRPYSEVIENAATYLSEGEPIAYEQAVKGLQKLFPPPKTAKTSVPDRLSVPGVGVFKKRPFKKAWGPVRNRLGPVSVTPSLVEEPEPPLYEPTPSITLQTSREEMADFVEDWDPHGAISPHDNPEEWVEELQRLEMDVGNPPPHPDVAVEAIRTYQELRLANRKKTSMRQRMAQDKPLVWPVYRNEKDREDDEVKEVFRLTGGELEDTPWAGYQYWYEGVPDYAERDFDWTRGEFKTVIVTGGGMAPSPEKEMAVDGEVWELQEYYNNSGETECAVCGYGVGDFWKEGFEEEYGRPPGPGDSCGLCEYKMKDMPGYIYIGEGYEAVYKLIEEEEDDEDLYEARVKKPQPRKAADLPSQTWEGLEDYLRGVAILTGEGNIWVNGDCPRVNKVNISIVHDASGFNPGAAIFVEEAYNHPDSALQGAFEVLEQHTMEDREYTDELYEEWGDQWMEIMTEGWDGRVWTDVPAKVAAELIGADNSAKEYIDVEWYSDSDECDD